MFCIKLGMRIAANEDGKKKKLIPYCWQSQLGISLFHDSYIKNWGVESVGI